MDLSKVKLVVSDMDGTLLNTNGEVSTRFLNQFKALKKRNIRFVAASGRQYHSIIDKLSPIKNDISIIAENGGIMQHLSKIRILSKLDTDTISESLKALKTIKDIHMVLCGEKAAYVDTNDPSFILKLDKHYANYQVVNDLTEVTGDVFLKLAVFHPECSETHIFPAVKHLSKNLQITVSDKYWLDISHTNANKGYALNMLQKELGISEEDTMVFGDYNNDLKMLERAHFSFAMENAHPNVKKVARYTTKSNAEEGVETILEQLIDSY